MLLYSNGDGLPSQALVCSSTLHTHTPSYKQNEERHPFLELCQQQPQNLERVLGVLADQEKAPGFHMVQSSVVALPHFYVPLTSRGQKARVNGSPRPRIRRRHEESWVWPRAPACIPSASHPASNTTPAPGVTALCEQVRHRAGNGREKLPEAC